MDDCGDHSDAEDLAVRFREFATTTERRAPLYAALSTGIAGQPDLWRLLRHAPPTQRAPVLLFAVVHQLLLGQPTAELAQWYPNLTEDPRPASDPAALTAFHRFVEDRRDQVVELLATRATQTNEVGRCGFLMPVLAMVAAETGLPLAHLDVGTSAGLNLLTDRYEYRYRTRAGDVLASVGDPSPVRIDVDVSGPMPLPATPPPIAARLGIDRSPIDVTDTHQAQWLEACVWPDQADRFHRLVAAIEIARATPPEIVAGDAVETVGGAVDRLREHGHPVVTNSWVLSYFPPADRTAYLAELDRQGAAFDLSWISAEAPALVPELPTAADPADPERTVVSLVRWRNGRRTVDHLATVHPHGYWISWR